MLQLALHAPHRNVTTLCSKRSATIVIGSRGSAAFPASSGAGGGNTGDCYLQFPQDPHCTLRLLLSILTVKQLFLLYSALHCRTGCP